MNAFTIKHISANETILNIGTNFSALFSYETLVAIHWNDTYYRDSTKYSITTAKHINQFCGGRNEGVKVDNETLQNKMTDRIVEHQNAERVCKKTYLY